MADVVTIRTSKGVPFTVARQHAERFQRFLDDPDWGPYDFDPKQSGGYNPRNIAGTNIRSQHAHGNAIDLNWTRNARGTAGDIDPALARRLAQRHGLTWGGDWSNPDPMHFEVAQTGATPIANRGITAFAGLSKPSAPAVAGMEQRTPMATYTPQSGVAPFQGDTPEQVEFYRRRANALLQQGSDISPVGHWSQALARVAQGGMGGLNQGWARTGELQGKQSLANVLAGAGSAQEKTSALLSNPWGADLGAKLATAQLQSQLQSESPAGQLELDIKRIGLDKAKAELDVLKRKDAIEEAILGETGMGGRPAAPTSAPITGPTALPQVPGIAVAEGAPAQSPAPAVSAHTLRSLLATRSPAERMAFLMAYRKDPAKASEMVQAWLDPNKKQEEARQKELGEAQAKAQAALPGIISATDRLLGQIDRVSGDPYLPSVTGPIQGSLPTLRGRSVDVEERIKQLGGAAFLQAFEALKGGGAIQEKEGEKATAALARLGNLRQSDKGFREALKEFRDEVVRLRQLAADRAAGRVPMPSSETGAPSQQSAADPLGIR